MALSSATIWEVRTTGSDTNGGGFVAGASGTDWSQQDSAQYAVTDAVTNGTTTITSATANFGTDVVGNILYIQGGTGSITADWYEITARTNSTTITVERSTGLTTGTGATLNIGGALLTVEKVRSLYVSNNKVWLKGTTFAPTGAAIDWNKTVTVEGYSATRGDGGLAVIDASGMTTSEHAFLRSAGVVYFANIHIQNAKNCSFFDNSVSPLLHCLRCVSESAVSHGFSSTYGQSQRYVECGSFSNGGGGFSADSSSSFAQSCWAGLNTSDGFLIPRAFGCLAFANSGIGFNTDSGGNWESCASYDNTSHGFSANYTDYAVLRACWSWGNGGYGYYSIYGPSGGSNQYARLLGCAAGDNTSGPRSTNMDNTTFGLVSGFITLTADPTVDGSNATLASKNFALNNTSGGGAALRAAGFPGAWVALAGTTGYRDVGALQHQDSGGSVAFPPIGRFF